MGNRNYTILGQELSVANTLKQLYSVPASNNAVISTVNICNLSDVGGHFSLACNVNGVAVANANMLAFRVPIPARDTIALTLGITLNAASKISVNANTALISFAAFGTELY